MSKVKWTKEQEKVIDARNCNLLVAAAAGSGKTAVLVERIIQMVMDSKNPIDIDKLLVVTFTNAAASEMRERIAQALSKEISSGGNYQRLQRQLTLLNKASITTIHSFCLNIIRNNFHKLDLDPGFRVADETEVVLLKSEVMDEVFEDNYNNNEEFIKLVDAYCGNRDDKRLADLVLRIYRFSISAPDPTEWLNRNLEKFNVENIKSIKDCDFVDVLKETLAITLDGIYAQYQELYNIASGIIELEPYADLLSDEMSMVNDLKLTLERDFESFLSQLKEISFDRLPTIRNLEDKTTKEQLQGLRNELKKELEKLKSDYESLNLENIIGSYKGFYPILKELCKIVTEFSLKYKEKKRKKGIIDFNDFEHFAIDLLIEKDDKGAMIKDAKGQYIPTVVALDLREKYSEILIDEYQDSNFTQELILNSVSTVREGKPNIFMVGDIKQSIYRFRQAKPELFLNKYNTYKDDESELYRRILLFKNFRSRVEVLQGINLIFKAIMSKNIGELNYDDKESLYLGADYPHINLIKYANEEYKPWAGGNIELEIFEKEDVDNKEDKDANQDQELIGNIQYEARIVVKKIKNLVENRKEPFMVLDKETKEYRQVKYRDIVILLRSTVNRSQEFMEELKNNNIPSYADVSTGYFDTQEVKTMLSLLEIIDNPRQDIPLLCIMRCPTIGSFTSEDFIEIKIKTKSNDFYSRCMEYIKCIDSIDCKKECNTDPDELEKEKKLVLKLQNFFSNLKKWSDKALYIPTDELIWCLYTETGYYGFVGALENGIQRQANLKILFQRARQYENTSYKGLFNFISFINKLKSNSGDMGSAKIIGENENVVRIMSIHKSKGLEFPVVFLCNLDKNFNLMDLNSNLLLDYDLGFGPDYIDIERRISYPLPVKKAIRQKILLESLSEEMRILYVALTRAREKLILVGGAKDVKKYIDDIYIKTFVINDKVLEYSIMNCKSYLEWIMFAICKSEKQGVPHNIDITVWSKEDLNSKIDDVFYDRGKVLKDTLDKYISSVNKNDKIYDIINERLNYEMIMNKDKIPTVLTVSEIKRRYNLLDSEDTPGANIILSAIKKTPRFMEGAHKLSGAEKGTATHEVMQYLDLNNVARKTDISNQMLSMVNNEFITIEQMKAVDVDKVFNFFESDIGRKLLKSIPNVYREKEFHIPIKVKELPQNKLVGNLEEGSKDGFGDYNILLQGIIDCYFITENNEIVLLDYKTDKVKLGQEKEFIDKYRVQLDYYKRAIEQLTGLKVVEKNIYSFCLNKGFIL